MRERGVDRIALIDVCTERHNELVSCTSLRGGCTRDESLKRRASGNLRKPFPQGSQDGGRYRLPLAAPLGVFGILIKCCPNAPGLRADFLTDVIEDRYVVALLWRGPINLYGVLA